MQSQLRDLSAVDILQVDLVNVVNGTGFLRARVPHATTEHATERTPAAAEELRKEILSAHSTTGTTTFETFFTKLIIEGALLRVRQDFVGVRQLLELFRGLGVICVLVCYAAALSVHAQDTDFYFYGLRYSNVPGWYLRAPFL